MGHQQHQHARACLQSLRSTVRALLRLASSFSQCGPFRGVAPTRWSSATFAISLITAELSPCRSQSAQGLATGPESGIRAQTVSRMSLDVSLGQFLFILVNKTPHVRARDGTPTERRQLRRSLSVQCKTPAADHRLQRAFHHGHLTDPDKGADRGYRMFTSSVCDATRFDSKPLGPSMLSCPNAGSRDAVGNWMYRTP